MKNYITILLALVFSWGHGQDYFPTNSGVKTQELPSSLGQRHWLNKTMPNNVLTEKDLRIRAVTIYCLFVTWVIFFVIGALNKLSDGPKSIRGNASFSVHIKIGAFMMLILVEKPLGAASSCVLGWVSR